MCPVSIALILYYTFTFVYVNYQGKCYVTVYARLFVSLLFVISLTNGNSNDDVSRN